MSKRETEKLITLCAHCQSIQTELDGWTEVHTPFPAGYESMFCLGICPECTDVIFPNLVDPDLLDGRPFVVIYHQKGEA